MEATTQIQLGKTNLTIRFDQYAYDLGMKRWDERNNPTEEDFIFALCEMIYCCYAAECNASGEQITLDPDTILWQLGALRLVHGYERLIELAKRIMALVDSAVVIKRDGPVKIQLNAN